MTKMVENQRNWDAFQVTKKVGIICTYFSEQFLDESFEIVKLTPENFQEEIELNGINTIFIDNDIYETDHMWYKKDRSNLFRYFRNENRRHFSKNVIVIKNSEMDVGSIFRNSFVLDIDLDSDFYFYQEYQFKIPLQINYREINPSINQNKKSIDLVNLSLGSNNTNLSMQDGENFNIKNVRIKRFSRTALNNLISDIINARILFISISKTEYFDSKVLKYIEILSTLSSTKIVFNDLDSEYNKYEKREEIQYLLRNEYYSWERILDSQRNCLMNHTSLITGDFSEFMDNRNRSKTIPQISVITTTNRLDMLERYFDQMNSQEHVLLEINLVLDGINLNETKINYIKTNSPFKINFIESSSSESLGQKLNNAVSNAENHYIAKIDDDDFYGSNYMIDQWLSLKYSNADMVGKSDTMYYFEDDDSTYLKNNGEFYEFTDSVHGSTIFSYKNVLEEIPFANISKAVEINLLRRFVNRNFKIYSNHPFGMCVLRKSDKSQHVLQVDDILFKNALNELGFGIPKKYIDL